MQRLQTFAGWRIHGFLLCLLLCLCRSAGAQTGIARVEYYVDTDPGLGNATSAAFTSQAQLSALNISLSPALLTAGVHRCYVRAMDSNGRWSLTQQMLFFKPGAAGASTATAPLSFGEWFIDTDPGRGSGTRVSFPPGTTDTSVICAISPASLSTGIHRFCFRAKDTLGNWSLVQQWLFWKPAPVSAATRAKIAYLEYFVDSDPGPGSATPVTGFTPDTSVSISAIAVPVSSLSLGLHKFCLRARDSSGAWSLVQQLTFLKPGPTASSAPAPPLDFAEWFVDVDPGYGNAARVSFPSGTYDTALVVAMPAAALGSGIHRFNFRARDTSGKWSLIQQLLFFKPAAVSSPGARSKIAYVEYYLDNDPGKGSATAISGFTPDTVVNVSPVSISVSSLSTGLHRLNIRGRDSLGNWSLDQQLLFFKPGAISSASPLVPVTYAEWYVDNDPGLGSATPLSFSSGAAVVNAIAPVNVNGLSAGLHWFTVRARDSLGRWSLSQRYLFYKPAVLTSSYLYKVARLEYYIDNDPGLGSGTVVSIMPDTLISNQLVPVSTSGLSLGSHKLYLRAKDSAGKWGLVNTSSFTLISSALSVGAVASGKCAGTSLTVPYTVSGTFNAGNKFRVQLSNSSGLFTDTVSIGSKSGTTSDSIVAVIPANTVAGLNYRVRVLASLPADTSAPNSLPLEIKNTPTIAFTVSGAALTCTDTEAYVISPVQSGISYTWQLPTGGTLLTTGTTAYVAWTSAGTHLLTATSANTCGSGAYDTIAVTVYNGGTTTAPTLSLSVNTIYITNSAPSGTTGYEWYRNDTLIATTSAAQYTVSVNGNYKAAFVNSCGAGTRSSALAITHLRLFQSITFRLLRIRPLATPLLS